MEKMLLRSDSECPFLGNLKPDVSISAIKYKNYLRTSTVSAAMSSNKSSMVSILDKVSLLSISVTTLTKPSNKYSRVPEEKTLSCVSTDSL